MNAISVVEGMVISFKGKEMTHDQNMAVFNLIESILGEDAADAFSKSMESSDELHNQKTTYTYLKSARDVWDDILQAGLNQ